MNPRKRRTIARAIMAGISPSELNSTTIKAFLEAERNNLDICTADINSILEKEDNPVVPDPEVVNVTTTTNENSTIIVEDDVINETNDTNVDEENNNNSVLPAGLQIKFSMKNTKTQLLKAAKNLGLEVKSNMTKANVLNLIESV